MAGKPPDSTHFVAIKLNRILKKRFDSAFNGALQAVPTHPVAISPLWTISTEPDTPEYQWMSSFNKLYVGEGFTACVSLSNQASDVTLHSIFMTCHMQYQSKQGALPLLFQVELPRLAPQETKVFAFTLMVDQPDVYYLNFQLHFYIKDTPEPSTLKKMFKFDAKLPLECKNFILRRPNSFIVQSNVTNCTSNQLLVSAAEFTSSAYFKLTDLNESTFDSRPAFLEGEIRSYLFRLTEINAVPPNVELGRLMVSWYNTYGDIGKIASQAIMGSAKSDTVVSLEIEEQQKWYIAEQPVTVHLVVANRSNFYLEDVSIVVDDRIMRRVLLSPSGPKVSFLGRRWDELDRKVEFRLK